MKSAPVIAFVAGVIIAACVVQSPPPAQPLPSNQYAGDAPVQAAPTGLVPGDYRCKFDDYSWFACQVWRDRSGRVRLEKLSGSQRVRGWVTEGTNGFGFEGQFYCPWGSCDQAVRAEFRSDGGGRHVGTLPTQHGAITVVLEFLPGGFAGASYAGVRYGGLRYGGGRYGGARYTGVRR